MKKINSLDKSEINKLSQISKIIKQSKTFFIAGHVKPDGDSLGSALALRSMLNRYGKRATVYCADDIPDILNFLPGAKLIKKTASKNARFDCAVILESASFSRMGDIISPQQAKKIINIDHHSMFTDFGDVNYIVPDSASTAELVLKVFEYMKIEPNKSEAECLYTGIVTDTGRFQQLNTTADSHIAAAKLMSYGVSPNSIYEKVYQNNSIAGLKLLGYALCEMETDLDGKFAYMKLTKDIFKKCGAGEDETEGIINFTLMAKGVKVGCLFKEVDKNTTKVGFRSAKGFNVFNIARKCGGGGHKNAAGCTLKCGIDEAPKIISKILKENMDGKSK